MNATPSLSLTPPGGGAPPPNQLKAERVQLAAASVQARLKAERVQQKLRALPGWRLVPGGKAVDRVREFPDPRSAVAYAGFLAEFASRSQQPIGIELSGARVAITLWAKPRHGRRVGMTEAVLNFARALG